MVRLIVFDLDGTLIDSRRDLAESGNALLAGFDVPPLPDEAVVAMVGEGARTLVSRILDARGVKADVDAALTRFLQLYDDRLTNHTDLYPGVRETLADLKDRAALAVLTNKPQAPTDRLLMHFGLSGWFVDVIGGDTPFGRKPDPAGLNALRRRVGAAADETLMVGDSWVDIETARRAGTRACFAGYGFGLRPQGGLLDAEPQIASFDGVLALMNGAVDGRR
jgi:phosphoglycolate phosphatase